jgi:sigma-B regulation protein RsbU (phosphoserine phosphatase)
MATDDLHEVRKGYREGLFRRDAEDMGEVLEVVLDTVKTLSCTTDPREMVTIFTERLGSVIPRDHSVSITRRGLDAPRYRIARCSRWEDTPDPWDDLDRLLELEGGILGQLIFENEPVIVRVVKIGKDDPAYDILHDISSMLAIPNYDGGEALNMMILLGHEVNSFDPSTLPELVWTSNIFGRAVHNLRVGEELKRAYETIDAEVKVVSDLQCSLLPKALPDVPTLDLSVHYQTARQAGGDYYDFFPLSDGRLGILIADVSGHGPAAAVLMAITHSLFHTSTVPLDSPAETLRRANQQLFENYTSESRTFVTAFYGVYDPSSRNLTYCRAGHDPPRVCGGDSFSVLDAGLGIPLGISDDAQYSEAKLTLNPGAKLVLYTDGITEAHGPGGELFGTGRLDTVLCGAPPVASELVEAILTAVADFTENTPAHDDRTLVVASIS